MGDILIIGILFVVAYIIGKVVGNVIYKKRKGKK